jgi:hypothetical protein
MRTTKINQRIARTIQVGDNDYIKLDISKEVELEQYLSKDNLILWEDDSKIQMEVFEQIKQELNKQTKDLLKNKKDV